MSSIINIEGYNPPLSVARSAPRGSDVSTTLPAGGAEGRDRVEFSRLGTALAEVTAASSLRLARISAIRDEIARGVYETPERIDRTVDRLLDVVG